MNYEERRKFADENLRRVRIFESKYAKVVSPLIRKQIDKVIEVLKSSGYSKAKSEIKKLVFDVDLHKALLDLYKTVGLYYAKHTAFDLKQETKKSGGLGQNQDWIDAIIEAFQLHIYNAAILRINDTTRDRIFDILSQGERQGLGIEEMAKQLASPQLTINRARVIARTETGKAANVGREVAVADYSFELDKEWITAGDELVRDAHAEMDGTVIANDDDFVVDGEQMNGPGDPSASPELIINCRCSMAFIPRRNASGRLIPKS